MPKSPEPTLRLGVLDRLLADPPGGGFEAAGTSSASVRELKAAVLRDLEWLLNTRRIADPAPDDYPEVQRSVYHFGLPDITSLSGDSDAARRRLRRQIEECVQLFEPRLTSVRVSPVEPDQETPRHLRFLIDGMLRVDPNPERVTFDTVLETASGEFVVTGERNA